jgi:hypothetical protein
MCNIQLCAGPDADNRSLASNTGSQLKRGQSHGSCSLHSAGDLEMIPLGVTSSSLRKHEHSDSVAKTNAYT